MLGPGVKLFSENHVFEDIETTIKSQGVKREFLTIGDDVWIGSGATITAGGFRSALAQSLQREVL